MAFSGVRSSWLMRARNWLWLGSRPRRAPSQRSAPRCAPAPTLPGGRGAGQLCLALAQASSMRLKACAMAAMSRGPPAGGAHRRSTLHTLHRVRQRLQRPRQPQRQVTHAHQEQRRERQGRRQVGQEQRGLRAVQRRLALHHAHMAQQARWPLRRVKGRRVGLGPDRRRVGPALVGFQVQPRAGVRRCAAPRTTLGRRPRAGPRASSTRPVVADPIASTSGKASEAPPPPRRCPPRRTTAPTNCSTPDWPPHARPAPSASRAPVVRPARHSPRPSAAPCNGAQRHRHAQVPAERGLAHIAPHHHAQRDRLAWRSGGPVLRRRPSSGRGPREL